MTVKPLPSKWTSDDALAAGYFFSCQAVFPDDDSVERDLSLWSVWHMDHRSPLTTNINSLPEAIAWAREHETGRRVRALLRANLSAASGDAVIGAHYDGPPLAVGTVPQAAMHTARAYIEAMGIDPVSANPPPSFPGDATP